MSINEKPIGSADAEFIEKQDEIVGTERAKVRKRIADAQMREELKELDLTPEEYLEIFA